MHSAKARPKAYLEYMKEKMRPDERILTYMSFKVKILVVFWLNDV